MFSVVTTVNNIALVLAESRSLAFSLKKELTMWGNGGVNYIIFIIISQCISNPHIVYF